MSFWSRLVSLVRPRSPEGKRATYDPATYFKEFNGGYLFPSITFRDTDAERLMIASSWCYAAISGNARTMAALPPVVQVREGEGDSWRKDEGGHQLWSWLKDPLGPDPILPFWSWAHLMEVSFQHRYVGGNAFWKPALVAGGRKIQAVVPIMSPASMTAVENKETRAPEKFVIHGVELAPSQVVNIMAPSPSSFWKGLSPLRAALRSVTTDSYAAARQEAALRNRIGIGTIVAIKTPLGPTPEQRENTKTELETDYQSATQEGSPWIIGGDVEVSTGPQAQDLQYFDTRRFSRDEILAVIGMPPPVAGVYDRAILNNFKQANLIWWTHYLFPILNATYSAINAQLVQQVHGPDVRVWYDLTGSDIAAQLFDQRVATAIQLSKLGYCTNDINRRLDLGMEEHKYLQWPNTQLVQAGRLELEDIKRMIEEETDK